MNSPEKKHKKSSLDPVDLGIMWDRLVAIADAILLAMVRTSFSVLVREVRDIGCTIMDARGRAIAFGTDAVPGFNASAQYTIQHMLRYYPPETLSEGDVVVTNDPWMGGGHRPDIAVMRPIFLGDRIVGYILTYSHLPDIGGRGLTLEAGHVLEEGFAIPMAKLYRAGERNDELFDLLRANVRTPDQVIGDVMANVSGTAVGINLLKEFLEDNSLSDLQSVADGIVSHTEAAMRKSIHSIPDGVYRHEVIGEALGDDLHLACEITVKDDTIHVDFTGSSDVVPYAVNVTEANMKSGVCTVIKSLTTPDIPSNHGDVIPISAFAPEGSILNAPWPAPTGGRHMTASYIPSLIMGALAKAIPGRIMADVGMGTTFGVFGKHSNGREIATHYFTSGGLGAMVGRDARQPAPYPVNSSVIASELWEAETGLTVLKRTLLPDSGGAGKYRGGVGQVVEMQNDTGNPLSLTLFGVRTKYPARGYDGGETGDLRKFLIDGEEVPPKGRYALKPGGILTLFEAGGGGLGAPDERLPEKVLSDVVDGFVSIEGAARDYGVEIDPQARTAKRLNA